MVVLCQGQAGPIDRELDSHAVAGLRADAAAMPRYLRLQHRFALRQHQQYLVTLLTTYHGPPHPGWEAELARVRTRLAELDD